MRDINVRQFICCNKITNKELNLLDTHHINTDISKVIFLISREEELSI